LKDYKLWDSKNKKIMLRRYVTFDEASLLIYHLSAGGEDEKPKMYRSGGGFYFIISN